MRELPRALAVDDHPVNRVLVARQLEGLGWDVDSVADGHLALDRFERTRYAVVLLDCAMPGMDGFEVARRMWAMEKRSNRERTFVVACTAEVGPDVERRCTAAGMDDYVAKPIGTPALAACLARGRVLLPVQASFGGSVAAQAPLRVAVEPVDLEVLSASYGTDAVASRAMLEDFVEINAQDLEALLVALRERDARRVARQAHRMQGASKMVGAASLARIAARLESRAPDLDWSRIAALASVLAGECRRVERFVATSLRVSDPCRPRAGGRRSVDERLRLFPHVLL